MGACTVGQPSGTLEVTVNTGSAIDCFYFSSAAYDLTESEVVVEVPATAATGTTYASLREPSGIALEITVRDGDIHFGDAAVMPYSATDHRWWRFRADAAGAVAFDSAPDGATWLERGTVTPAFSLRALAVHLGVRTTSSSATSVARFDNVNLAP